MGTDREPATMPTRTAALKTALGKVIPGKDEALMFCGIFMQAGMAVLIAMYLCARLVALCVLPVSVAVLYPFIRRNQRRWLAYATKERREADALAARIEESMKTPVPAFDGWTSVSGELRAPEPSPKEAHIQATPP